MKVEKEQLGPSTWSLTIEVPAEESQAKVEEELRTLQRETSMPGFRKGKVPLSIIRKRFEQTIQMEVLRDKLGEYYGEAIKQADIGDPIAPPEMDIVQFEPNKPLILKAKVETKPPIELASYDGLTVVRENAEIGDKEIEIQLQTMREKQAVISDHDGPAAKDSLLEADLQELDSSLVPIIGHKQEGIMIDLGKAAEDFQSSLVGIEAGQSRNVSITRPPASPNEKPQTEHWQVTVKTVKKKELPELNDEFAKQVSEEIGSIDDLRGEIRKSLERQVGAISHQRMSHLLAHQVVDHSKLDIPDMMLKQYLDRIVGDAKKSDALAENGQFDEEFIRHQYRDRATWNLKWYLIRQRIAEVEELEVTDEDIEQEYQKMADATGKKLKQIKAAYSMEGREDQLRDDLLEHRVLQHLVSKAKVVEKTIPFEQFLEKDSHTH